MILSDRHGHREPSTITFSLYDSFTVGLEGNGPVFDHVLSTLRSFRTPTADQPDLTVRSEANLSAPETDCRLGGPNDYYATTGGDFVIVRHGEPVIVDRECRSIRASATASPNLVRLLVEWRIRDRFLDDGYAMVHGSGVRDGGETVVFPAWRHAGKTNTMLTFLNDGASFLADDRLFVGTDGTVRGYPTDLHFASYNHRSFPDLAPRPILSGARAALSETLDDLAGRNRSMLSKGIKRVNDALVVEDEWVPVDDLFPGSVTTFEGTLDKVVALRATTRGEPHANSIGSEELSDFLRAVNYREWDRDLLEIAMAHRALTQSERFVRSVRSIVEVQGDVFDELGERVPISSLEVPSDGSWSSETKRKLIAEVRSGR